MTRKVFWTLWVTVWPVVALAPHLLAALPTPERDQPRLASNSEAANRLQGSSRPTHGVKADRIASSKESRIPLLAQIDTPPDVKPQPSTPELLPTQPTPVGKKSESLPTIAEHPTAVTTNQPRTSMSRSQGIGPRLTPQEERAQQLIHERAVRRSLERHARLELKYRKNAGQTTPTPTTRWRPQATRTGWATGSREE